MTINVVMMTVVMVLKIIKLHTRVMPSSWIITIFAQSPELWISRYCTSIHIGQLVVCTSLDFDFERHFKCMFIQGYIKCHIFKQLTSG